MNNYDLSSVILFIFVIFIIILLVVLNGGNCGCSNFSLKNGITIPIEQYSLIPKFINRNYGARFWINSPNNIFPKDNYLLFGDNDVFNLNLNKGDLIHYYISDLKDDKVILSADYKLKDDITSIKRIYLCDGVIVSDLEFIPEFKYVFTGDWSHTLCNTMILSWFYENLKNKIDIQNMISDDSISCISPPGELTMPYTYYSRDSKPMWKGAWVGMEWMLYTVYNNSNINFGSIKIKNTFNDILLIGTDGLSLTSSLSD